MIKLRAFLLHLGISLTVVGSVFAIVFFVWYPHPYFKVIGAWNVVRILILVDLIIGPLLTLIVYKPKKPGIKFDLSMIALIQLSALVYGVSVIYQERPFFNVFAIDHFEVLAEKDVDFSKIELDEFKRKPLIGPALAVATLPEDEEERQKLTMEIVFENKPDIEHRPEYWGTYAARKGEVLARARTLAELEAERVDAAAKIAKVVQKHGGDATQLKFLPIIGKSRDLALVLDANTAVPLDAIDVDPWLEQIDAVEEPSADVTEGGGDDPSL